jgi:hypothetical protein
MTDHYLMFKGNIRTCSTPENFWFSALKIEPRASRDTQSTPMPHGDTTTVLTAMSASGCQPRAFSCEQESLLSHKNTINLLRMLYILDSYVFSGTSNVHRKRYKETCA